MAPDESHYRARMTRLFSFSLPALALLLVTRNWCGAQTAFEQACTNLAARTGDDAARLHQLFKLDWDHKKITPPRITLRDVSQQIKAQMETDPQKSPLLKSFSEFPQQIPEADRTRLRREAAEAVQNQVAPAFGKPTDCPGPQI